VAELGGKTSLLSPLFYAGGVRARR
jgi:hypothetical protein